MKSLSSNRQSGAVSLFVVIFAMLIITVVTVSFLRLMIADQQQASDNDLSRSAYDSAQAGVEDAKRALLRYQQICNNSPSDCGTLRDQLSSSECNAGVALGEIIAKPESSGSTYTGEVKVQQTESVDKVLQQAYTCVLMQLETIDYIGDLSPGESQLVPLVGRDNFSTVTVRWFSRDDVSNTEGTVERPNAPSNISLPSQTNWPSNRPSLMRAQLIQFGGSFTMDSFDSVVSSGGTTQSNANTVFLYPSSTGATTGAFTGLDTRKNSPTADPDPDQSGLTPRGVQCQANFNSTQYACSMTLTLPEPIGGGTARTAFLRLTPFYNSTHFQVVLSNGDPNNTTNIVRFRDVQPIIDSTGRANDVFRRIESRVDLYNTNFPYPDATIDITGNFCKSFAVSDDSTTYRDTVTACTP